MTRTVELYLPEPPASIRPSLQGVGSAFTGLSGFIAYYVARQQDKRNADVQAFAEDTVMAINDLCREQEQILNELENKIDTEHFWSDDFFRVFRKALENCVHSPDQEKRKYLLDFVVNYSREKRPDLTLEKLFWGHLSALTGTHLVVLDLLAQRQLTLNSTDLAVLRTSPESKELVSLRDLSEAVTPEQALLDFLLADLMARGLVEKTAGPVSQEDSSMRFLLTTCGRSLMRFISGEWP